MQITFLDASTLAAADLDLTALESLGTLSAHPTTSPAETIGRCRNADIIITNKALLTAETFSACPGIKLVLVAATGVNCVDLEAARARGIPVCNVAGYSTSSVAQHTVALLLNLATRIHRLVPEAPLWPQAPIFTRLDHPAFELAGKSLGIAGLGDIGGAVARIALSLGMTVHALRREGSSHSSHPAIPRLDHQDFFSASDVVSLHCPLTPGTQHLINHRTLGLMKPTALLLNTSRGPLIDEAALASALRAGTIAGAGLDVLSTEAPSPHNPLLAPDLLASGKLLITPHTAWGTREARQRLVDGLAANLRAFLHGSPINRVA